MKDYLNIAKNRLFLSLGDREFSPVVQASTAIALDYSKEVENSGISKPMLLTFPFKESTVLWISVQYLVNKFFENYIYQSENRIKELKLKPGDKIDIFSTTAVFKRIDKESNKLVVGFSDGIEASSAIQNSQFVNLARKKMVNKYHHYQKKKKEFLRHRRALTQILGLSQNPNFGALVSKIVIISGRGKAGYFRNQLREIKIYNESLSEVMLLNENLIISPDFTYFSEAIPRKYKDDKAIFFSKILNKELKEINPNTAEISLAISNCLRLAEGSLRTKQFLDSFKSLCDELALDPEYDTLSSKLKKISILYPGIESNQVDNVSAVFINDIKLALENINSIEYLLRRQVPVFIISDRVITDYRDLDIYTTIFAKEEFRTLYKFNWDKIKLGSLGLQFDDGVNYIDSEINNLFYRYINQRIIIRALDPCGFDDIFSSIESYQFLSLLKGYEIMGKAYYQLLRPLLYIVKNSIDKLILDKLLIILERFVNCFESSSAGMSAQSRELLSETLEGLRKYLLSGNQPKRYIGSRKDLMFQNIRIGDANFTVPSPPDENMAIHYNKVSIKSDRIVFIGYPYREYSFKFIDQSIFKKFVPSVELILNQCEVSVTINFLRRKISSGFFVESYPECINELDKYRISNEQQLSELIEGEVIIDKATPSTKGTKEDMVERFDEFEQMLSEIMYSGYSKTSYNPETAEHYVLSSDVLHFENGSYLFLPHGSEILTIKESISGVLELYPNKVGDIAVGDIVVIVDVSRRSIANYLAGSKAMASEIRRLNTWRNILRIQNNICSSTQELVSRLSRVNQQFGIGGSAEIYNVVRWLNDEMLLAPAENNLKMILALEYPPEELDHRIELIRKSKLKIMKAKRKLDKAVREEISRMIGDSHYSLENDFDIHVKGIKAKAEKAELIGIEKRSDLRIDYHSTMKFLNK